MYISFLFMGSQNLMYICALNEAVTVHEMLAWICRVLVHSYVVIVPILVSFYISEVSIE